MTTARKPWSWRSRLLLLLFAVAPMLGISWWSLGELEETYQTNVKESLAAIARAGRGHRPAPRDPPAFRDAILALEDTHS